MDDKRKRREESDVMWRKSLKTKTHGLDDFLISACAGKAIKSNGLNECWRY